MPVVASTVCAFFSRLALALLAVQLPLRAIIVGEGIVLQSRLAFLSQHVAKVANKLLHKVHEQL